jgi:hypothetical protein
MGSEMNRRTNHEKKKDLFTRVGKKKGEGEGVRLAFFCF